MAPKIGYLLPTRERIMLGEPDAAALLALAERAESLGYDSIWAGDSLLARPRHEPLTLLAGVAGRTRNVELGTAILLPALRNAVLLAHQVATVDQVSGGRLILGVGIARDVPNIRAEFASAGVPFDKRVGRLLEELRLCRALWTGEPVDWDGRWTVEGGVLAPTPHRPGGPPIWMGGDVTLALKRAGRYYDGWSPTGPDAEGWKAKFAEVKGYAQEAGRDPEAVIGAIYLTLEIDDDVARAEQRLDAYLEEYYGQPAAGLKQREFCYAGPAAGAAEWIAGYVEAGVSHVVLRMAGDPVRNLERMADVRAQIGG